MGHGLILTNCRGPAGSGVEGLGAGGWRVARGATTGADFTLENSGNGASKEELRSREGSRSDNAKNLAVAGTWIGIRRIGCDEDDEGGGRGERIERPGQREPRRRRLQRGGSRDKEQPGRKVPEGVAESRRRRIGNRGKGSEGTLYFCRVLCRQPFVYIPRTADGDGAV